MRKFSSYGPINKKTNYYVPRNELIDQTCQQLLGEGDDYGGHYITVWAPRQTGKTWLLLESVQRLKERDDFDVVVLTMQSAKSAETTESVLEILVSSLRNWFARDNLPYINDWKLLPNLFTSEYFDKPFILILDEFDAMKPEFINAFANEFRAIHTLRRNTSDSSGSQVQIRLHGMALIGVRSVLGVENVSGSPFNVQRSVHVPNLTKDEVVSMFKWYEEESGQTVENIVVDRLYYETRGQPGLVSWFGELLTETYNRGESAITEWDWNRVYSAGLNLLPNNNILNIISKANVEPYRDTVLKLFETEQKFVFRYDNRHLNFLYLNGVVEPEPEEDFTYSTRFASPFVQKRLFHYFADELTPLSGRLYDPFEDMSETITDASLSVPHLMRRYETYLRQNREQILKNAPRRETDNRVIEAIFHFNLYAWLNKFITEFDGQVTPEFPTGNGQIDLLVTYAERLYGIEVKSFSNRKQYQKALGQASLYGKSLGQDEMWLVFFVEAVDDENRQKFEVTYSDPETGVNVYPILLVIGA